MEAACGQSLCAGVAHTSTGLNNADLVLPSADLHEDKEKNGNALAANEQVGHTAYVQLGRCWDGNIAHKQQQLSAAVKFDWTTDGQQPTASEWLTWWRETVDYWVFFFSLHNCFPFAIMALCIHVWKGMASWVHTHTHTTRYLTPTLPDCYLLLVSQFATLW